jgi:O-antigen/teichoic acid export membrane protein
LDTKQRVFLNSLYNVSGRGFAFVLSLFLIPFMVDRLGPGAYAIVPLVMYSILPFLEIFTSGVATSLGRYVTLHRSRREIDEANRYFNTSFFLLVLLCMVAAAPVLALSYYFPQIFKVERGWEEASRWTMLLAGISFFVTALSSPFGAGMYYRQRFDLRNLFYVAGLLGKVAAVVLLFILIGANTVYVAVGMVIAASIQGGANLITGYRMMPGLKTSWALFSREKLRAITAFSFYLLISKISTLLFLSTDNFLINWFIGNKEVTTYNFGAQIARLMRGFAETSVYVLGPLLTSLYATAQHDRLRGVLLKATRVMHLIVSPIAIFLCVLAMPFMTAWIGGVKGIEEATVRQAVSVLWVLVLPAVVNLSVTPAFPMFLALGRVRGVAFVSLAAAVANVGLSLWLALGLGLGIVGIALGSTICLLAKNTAFVPWYVCRLCRVKRKEYYRLFPGPILACLPGAAIAIVLQYLFVLRTWPGVILLGVVCFASYAVLIYLWLLTDEEKSELWATGSQVWRILTRGKEPKSD